MVPNRLSQIHEIMAAAQDVAVDESSLPAGSPRVASVRSRSISPALRTHSDECGRVRLEREGAAAPGGSEGSHQGWVAPQQLFP